MELGNAHSADEPEKTTSKAVTDTLNYPKSWKLLLITLALFLGTLLVAIDNTIIATAIPEISSDFRALDEVAWYGSGYLLTVTAFQPSYGKVYKFFNVKSTYIVSIIIFEGGSILCAAAPSSAVFILGRAISGVGAAGLFQGALCIVGLSVPLEKRPLFLAIVVSAFGLATCCGPILGGALTSSESWRWCFWINLPVGFVTLVLVTIFFKLRQAESENRKLSFKEKVTHMDLVGAASLIAAVSCLLVALQWGGTKYSWNEPRVISLFVLFGIFLVFFCVLQLKLGERGTIPPRLLQQRSVLMGCFYTFLLSMSNYTDGYYIPFYYQAVQGLSAAESGIKFIPLAFPEVVAIILVGVVVNRYGHYVPYMILGVFINIIGTALLTTIESRTSMVKLATYLVLMGIGIGLGINVPYTALQVVLSEDDIHTGNAVTVFFTQLGGAITLPISNAIFLGRFQQDVKKEAIPISPEAAMKVGPTNVRKLANDEVTMQAIESAYLAGFTYTLYLVLAATSLAVVFATCMEWKRLKVGGRAQEASEASKSESGVRLGKEV